MSTIAQLYPTLWSTSGQNETTIRNAFPWLCDLPALAQALEDSGILTDGDRNPNSYDKWDMALQVASYLNKHLNLTDTSRLPKSIKDAVNNGYHMSQAEFWSGMVDGIATVELDPGYVVGNVTLTDGGHHYATAPTVTVTAPTGTYHDPSVRATAQVSATLESASSIDYADFTDAANVHSIKIDTANSALQSDRIVGLSY